MKLIRLVTDNDGTFKSNFGNEMVLKENSKMALLNLTFESPFKILQIDSKNNKVIFQSDTTNASTVELANLPTRTYNFNEIGDFYNDLKLALNSAATTYIDGTNSLGSEFDIRLTNGLRQIEYRYSPFLNPLFLPNQATLMDLNNNLITVVTTTEVEGQFYNLENSGAPWQLSVGGTPQKVVTFTTTDLGTVAKYRSNNNDGSGEQWYVPDPTSALNWYIYDTKPTSPNDTADDTATLNETTFVLTLASTGNLLTPSASFIPLEFITPGPHSTISLASGVPEVADLRKNNLLGTGKLCLGSGLMTARVADFVDNSSGVQDNGFALCLSKTNLNTVIQPGDDIDVAYRDFEIRFNRDTEDYVFINKASGIVTEQSSGVTPHKTQISTSPIQEHDVIYYEVYAGVLSGGVLQDKIDTGGIVEKNEFFSYVLDPNDTYFPYMYIRGRKPHIKVDMFNYTVNPWVNNLDDGDDTPPYWDLTGRNYPNNPHSANSNGVDYVVTNGNIFSGTGINAMALPTADRWVTNITSRLTLSSQIWNFLGYYVGGGLNPELQESKTIVMGPNVGRGCWSIWAALQEPRTSFSDNFMVESMSVPLDSYDASEVFYSNLRLPDGTTPVINFEAAKIGRRKNILMTIPVNDNTNGIVEYEAQNLIFIDINNTNKLNLRNMDFRLLDKSFNPIQQSGSSAIMTILID